MLRIGLDVGGTHTDAVLLRDDEVVAWAKVLTTSDVLSGVLEALEQLLTDRGGIEASIQAVMLGTTQFTNAVVERRELAEVAAVRIGAPSGQGLSPKVGWPADIADALGSRVFTLRGGTLYDGTPLAAIDQTELAKLVSELGRSAVSAVSIAAVNSPIYPDAELRVGAAIAAELPDVHVTLSHQLGGLGILERENAALLNTSLLPFADRVVASFVAAVRQRGLSCPFFVSQNDGTLMYADFARRFPVLTFASGPTNSIRGACKLSGLTDAVVVDIGGTTSDIGVLRDGFPRESNVTIEVGGVRTNFRMPDLLALGLGGGSVVEQQGHCIGPRSVGHGLVSEAKVFGGDTLTATDIAVAGGRASIGDASKVQDLPPALIQRAERQMLDMLNRGIERMKPSADPLPVVLVGGGAVLVADGITAASELHRPPHAEVANAIGAAIAQIGGEAEQVISLSAMARKDAIAKVTAQAQRQAIQAGAAEATLRVSSIEETPLSYMAGQMTRLRVRVVGEIEGLVNP